jgi:uncharacterized protein DUF1592/uncharacterized protein DUF1588/uncharacterized protein DUF1587/uncharacterized protein DUF1585/uncharacterized protein DUF1595
MLAAEPSAGHVSFHRLNRVEYRNSVRDLFGVNTGAAQDLPPDDTGYGFDNVSDVLTLSPVLLERYFAAADRIVSHPEVRAKLLTCPDTAKSCMRRTITALARRAYRRPVTKDETDRLLRLARASDDGILAAARAILLSPNFLLRADHASRNPVELASRLSYFLWSSIPDEELLAAAERGRLGDPAVLEAQTRRMLADAKSSALIENFGGQWLQWRNLDRVQPDSKQFPEFDWPLRSAMRRETTLFFTAIVREDRSILDILDANFSFLNERLARHYGIAGVTGEEFRRVELAGAQRGGVLTQASVLTVTSYATRTSPVLRGKFLLETFLNAAPPPPPAGAPPLEPQITATPASMRQRMEEHRRNSACAACHSMMDPLGFALENYDAIGRWRESDGETPIDASAQLPDKRTFSGPQGLRAILKSQPAAFRSTLAGKLLTYALGRGLEATDTSSIAAIRERLAAHEDRFSELILGIVNSAAFSGGAR